MSSASIFAIAICAFALLMISTLIFLASRYKRCPSDKILVVYGKVGKGQHANCIHGGGAFIWPLIQDYTYLSLTPMTIPISLQNALSMQNIRINVPSTFTVGINTQSNIMSNAAERLLGLEKAQIESMSKEIIFGQLRLTVASLTIEQINQDRESFLEAIRKNVEPELNKIGLYLINVNITDITDESDYIESIGKKAAAEAVNKAKIEVANQEKLGAIGESIAVKEKTISVARNEAEAVKGEKEADSDKRIYVKQKEAEAITGENKSLANIAQSTAQLEIEQAEASQKSEVAKRNAEVEIQKAQYLSEKERLNAKILVQQEIEKRKIELAADAEAEKIRREAAGEADAILARFKAEATGTQKVLESKAAGYKLLVESCAGDARSAANFLLIEKLQEIVQLQVQAIKQLKIDKITVWDSGTNADGQTTTSNFISGLIKSLPPLQDITQMAGLELPEYLGGIVKNDADSDTNNQEKIEQQIKSVIKSMRSGRKTKEKEPGKGQG
ncbi:SPFH/Band 7/PHB domain protein [Candidatus Magnetomorum sp. HK-1]|nr:SPFH/Band 7/PHB domain protein [Candidatus Magnetomorum sp. HK-1]